MNNQLTPVSWQTVLRKSAVWIIWLFFLAVLQTALFSRLRVFGAVPNLILPAVITIAIYDKEREGTIAGIAGGFIIDALGGTGLSLSPLVYMICGTLCALLTYSFLRGDFRSWLVGIAVSLLISGGADVLCAHFSVSSAAYGAYEIWSELLIPQYFSSLVLGVPVWFLTKLIWSRLFDNREMEG